MKKKFAIKSPISGTLMQLEKLDDEVFAEKMLGDGIAIVPKNGNVFSPVEGVIKSIADTFHAIGIKSDDGIEILIHFGIDTVNLKGRGFEAHVKIGDKVHIGDLILKADLNMIKQYGFQTFSPIIITNCDKFSAVQITESQEVIACEDDIIFLNQK